jgi:tetratricopeptide (TPR) repeat protein
MKQLLWLVLVAACASDGKRFVELSNEGVAALKRDDPAAARTALREAVKLVPDDAEANYYLGSMDLREGKLDDAVARLTVAARTEPAWPEAMAQLARAQQAAHRSKDALATLQRLFRADRNHPAGHLIAGRIALELNDKSGADRHWRDAVAGDPGHAPAYVELAHLYGDVGAHEAARQVLEEGLKFARDAAELHEALGLVWLDLGRPDRAQQAFEQATHGDRARYQVHLNLAAAALQAGDRATATAALRTYVGLAEGQHAEPAKVKAAADMLRRLQAAERTVP